MLRITCSECGATYEVPDDRAGQTGKCRCGNLIPVQSAETPAGLAGREDLASQSTEAGDAQSKPPVAARDPHQMTAAIIAGDWPTVLHLAKAMSQEEPLKVPGAFLAVEANLRLGHPEDNWSILATLRDASRAALRDSNITLLTGS